MPPSISNGKNSQKIWEHLCEVEGVTWGQAQRMSEAYRAAKKDVSGNAECRRIGRMKIVLEMFLDELRDELERAERESE